MMISKGGSECKKERSRLIRANVNKIKCTKLLKYCHAIQYLRQLVAAPN